MKIDDLSAWEAFYWTAKDGSFTSAAKKMNLGLPALSRKIGRMEDMLAVRLFNRTTRKVSLTNEGQALFPQVENLLEDMRGIESALDGKGAPQGTIRMTCLTGLAHRWMIAAMADFRKIYPKIEFELEVSDKIVDLIEAQLDLAIRIQAPTGADFVFKKLASNDLVICASPSYLKRVKGVPTNPSHLAEHPLLLLKAHENSYFLNSKVRLKDVAKLRPIRCENGLYLTELALNGEGIAVRSMWDVRRFIKEGQLKTLLPKHRLENFGNIYAVVPSRRFMTARVRLFVDFLEEQVTRWAGEI